MSAVGLVFSIGCAALARLGLLLVVSVLRPARRIWPPPKRRSWEYRLVWSLIVFSSLEAWIPYVMGIAWFALAPLAEEPWLHEQYGELYERYRREVPRFLGARGRSD